MNLANRFRCVLTAAIVNLVLWGRLSAMEVSIQPTQDAMVREAEPTRNFGASGALAVAGATAVNDAGQPQGQFESVLQFDAGLATTAFDLQFGAGNWQLTGARLVLDQVAAPQNSIFNIGAGEIGVHWISDDNWLQGIGTPIPPPVDGGGNEVTWNFLQSLVAGASNSLVAAQVLAVQNGAVAIPLTLTTQLSGDILNGGFVSLFMAPRSPTVGLTFHAYEFPLDPVLRPQLVLTAQPIQNNQGDLNCDSAFNVQDIQPFALALTNPAGYAATFPACNIQRADVNNDGTVDGRDVAAFVDALIGP